MCGTRFAHDNDWFVGKGRTGLLQVNSRRPNKSLTRSMAADTATAGSAGNAAAEDTLESLLREAEALKQRLEEERQKLNDVTRECDAVAYMDSSILCLDLQFGDILLAPSKHNQLTSTLEP